MNDQLIRKLFRSTLTIQVCSALTVVLGVFVDGAVTGGCLGAKAMASYGFALPMTTITSGLASLFATGISVLCGQTISTGDKEGTNRIFSQCLTAALGISAILAAAGILGAEQLAGLLGADRGSLPETADYLRGFMLGVPGLFAMFILMPIMQIDGDRNRALIAICCNMGVNITLDLLNGFVFRRGLFVMALATTAGTYVGLGVLLLHFRKENIMFRFRLTKPTGRVLKEMLPYGFADTLQQTSRSVMNICLNWILMSVSGPLAVSAFSAIFTASTLCMALGVGIGETTAVINSVLVGEKNEESIRNLAKIALKSTLIYNVLLIVALFVLASPFMKLFLNSEPEALDLATTGFRLFIGSILFYGFNTFWQAFYQSMKLIRLSYAYAVLNNFICIVLSAFLMSRLWGLTGVWLSFAVGEILSLLIIILWNVSHNRGNTLFDKMLCIDDRFRGNILSSRGWSCASLNEAVSVSEAIRSYCNSEGAPSRTAFALSLAAEELCTNILHYGFADGKPHSIDLMVTRLTDGWMMRIRDDCQLFNPVQYVQLFDESDPSAHIGIRLTRGLIRKIDYISALKLNNLLLEIDS